MRPFLTLPEKGRSDGPFTDIMPDGSGCLASSKPKAGSSETVSSQGQPVVIKAGRAFIAVQLNELTWFLQR